MRLLLMVLLFVISSDGFSIDSNAVISDTENIPNSPLNGDLGSQYQLIEDKISKEAAELNSQNELWRIRLNDEIESIKNNEQQISNRLQEKQKVLARLNIEIKQTTAQKVQRDKEYLNTVNELELVKGTYQKSVATFSQQWQQSPTQLIETERQANLIDAKRATEFPSLNMLSQLINSALKDIKLTAVVSKATSSVSANNGDITQQDVAVVGGLMAILTSKPSGFIKFTDSLPSAVVPVNKSISESLQRWTENESQLLPFDLSQGKMLSSVSSQVTLADWVSRGGEILWPILLLAVIGVVIICWRGGLLFYWQSIPNSVSVAVQKQDDPQLTLDIMAKELDKTARAPAAKALVKALVSTSDKTSIESLDKHLQNSMLTQMSQFERGLGFIALLAAMAPMLGLLGTVSGMIETFKSLTEFGNSDPKLLSEGISKALITTQAGLLVALPLLLLHYPLKRRAQKLSLDMEQQASLLLALKIEQGKLNDSK